MPLGTPQGPSQSQWKIRASSVLAIGEYTVPFEITALPDQPDAEGVEEIIQRFVDLIASSPDFQVTFASRTYTYQERMTPTA